MRDETQSSSNHRHSPQQTSKQNMEKLMMNGLKRSRDENESIHTSSHITSTSSTSPTSSSSSYSSYSDESESPPTATIESTNDLHFSMLNKLKQKFVHSDHGGSQHQDHSMNLPQHNLLGMRNNDSSLPLMRLSSNASSISSTSSGVSTASSISSVNSNNFSVKDSGFIPSTAASSNLLNENHFKALIRSAQAAAAASVISNTSQNNVASDVDASKLALEETTSGSNINRSRSSSLSESSTTSAASSSSNSYNETSTHMNAALMKQFISSYNHHSSGVSTNKPLASRNENYVDGTLAESHSPLSTRKLSFTSSSSNNKSDVSNVKFQSQLLVTNQSHHFQHQQQQQQSSPSAGCLNVNGQLSNPAPCKVCGDEASGFHYGVDSCEGCKVINNFLSLN